MRLHLNYQLFDNFKEAAYRCDLDVIPGKGYYTVRLPNGRYIFCWTPLNKIWQLLNYYEKKDWDGALRDLKQEFHDFHLEFGGDTIEDMNLICECFCEENSKRDFTVDEIVNIINIMNDDKLLEQRLVWVRLKYGAEEE